MIRDAGIDAAFDEVKGHFQALFLGNGTTA